MNDTATHLRTNIQVSLPRLDSWLNATAGRHVTVRRSWEDDYASDYFEKGSVGMGFSLHTVFPPPENSVHEWKNIDTVNDPMIRSKGIIRTDSHWRHVCNSDYKLRLPTVGEGHLKTILDCFPEAYRGAVWEMEPGFKFVPHIDFPNGDTYRMHIAMWTNEDARFRVGDEEFHIPSDGHIWMINTGAYEHTAWNYGKTTRCHIHWQMPIETWDKYARQVWLLT